MNFSFNSDSAYLTFCSPPVSMSVTSPIPIPFFYITVAYCKSFAAFILQRDKNVGHKFIIYRCPPNNIKTLSVVSRFKILTPFPAAKQRGPSINDR